MAFSLSLATIRWCRKAYTGWVCTLVNDGQSHPTNGPKFSQRPEGRFIALDVGYPSFNCQARQKRGDEATWLSIWSDAVTIMPENNANGIIVIELSDVGKVIPGRFEIPFRGRKRK